MQRIWHRISGYWHVITGLMVAIYIACNWIGDVSGYEVRIESLDAKVDRIDSTVTRLDQKIDDLWKDAGHE